ncbi:TIGR03773 family transporter-associated surface protein [Rhizomonospora bruguierae]|uniref:TIGR03773 family transporter-associated surface protein n=1 Tax=Rhizomonospora bruguierae TaxID=1581705 RepID=UPI001BCC7672|nr:TIGR03773 family transporter-associated surface protein [Micromonospora sp. NBRC 107566]
MGTARVRAVATGFVAALLALAAGVAPADAATVPVDAAGADLVSLSVVDGTLSLRIRDAGQAVRQAAGRDPAGVTLGPEGGLAVRVPRNNAFAFLGAPGTAVWSLTPGDAGLPALDTTGVGRGVARQDAVRLSLSAAEGPGNFTAYTLSGLGTPSPLLSGTTRETTLPAATRTPVVWAFDTAGDYRLTLTASAALATGRTVTTEATYRISVPPIQPGPDAPPPAPAAAAKTPPPPLAAAKAASDAAPATPTAASPPAMPAAAKAAAAATATGGARRVISDGHVDMGPQLSGTDWTIRLRDDTGSPPVWRELADVVLQVKDNAKTTVPAGADFLGRPGETIWLLPQAQQSGIVWPGWNTQHESVVNGTRGTVTWTLDGVDGPGRFTLFLTGSFGNANVLFDSAKSLPQRLTIPPNTHAHGNWAFGKPGLYRLAVRMSATTTAGRTVTDSRTLTVAVGDSTNPNTGFGGGSGSGGGGKTGNGESGGGGRLPRTGESWVIPVVAGGVLLVLIGALLRVTARRRGATEPTR